jgi:hypothetical protein
MSIFWCKWWCYKLRNVKKVIKCFRNDENNLLKNGLSAIQIPDEISHPNSFNSSTKKLFSFVFKIVLFLFVIEKFIYKAVFI